MATNAARGKTPSPCGFRIWPRSRCCFFCELLLVWILRPAGIPTCIPNWTLLYSESDDPVFRIGRNPVPNPTTTSGKFITRHAEARVRTALRDTRIVAIVGPRQSGKTTLARRIASSDDRPFITLDDEQFRRFAENDPAGFIRGQRIAVIDEIQRAPGLILALKQSVDEDPRPGRYLITGSVDLFRSSISPDSLAGRVETIELLPFSRAEIAGAGVPEVPRSGFRRRLSEPRRNEDRLPTSSEHAVSGGYPEALSRTVPARRRHLAARLRSRAHRTRRVRARRARASAMK